MKHSKLWNYAWLVGVNLFISTFTFGGGYVVVPMIRKYFVQKRQLFQEEELMDMAAIAQSAPGAIAVNLTVLAGLRAAGLIGALLSCAAAILPPLVILGIISQFYAAFASNALVTAVLQAMQAGVAALIVDLVLDMVSLIRKERSPLLTLMIPGAFAANFLMHINVALILLVCCGICAGQVLWNRRRCA